MTKQPQHTPGPWHCESSLGLVRSEKDQSIIAAMPHALNKRAIKMRPPGDDAEITADARLIAAAPDLLEAAKEALRVFIDQGWYDDLIAERREDGFYYIHPKLKNVKIHHAMQPTRPTPIEDFGIEITISDGMISGKQVRDSVATYRDGKHRKWQGYPEFKFQYKGKP